MFKQHNVLVATIALLVTLGLAPSAKADVPGNVLTANLGSLATGAFALQFESALNQNSSFVIQGEFSNLSIGDWDLTGIGGGVGYRFYPGSKSQAPKGVWVGPLVKVSSISATYQGEGASSIYFTGGGEFGYQWLVGDETAFAIGLSLGIYYTAGTLTVLDEDLSYGGVLPGFGLNVGIAF